MNTIKHLSLKPYNVKHIIINFIKDIYIQIILSVTGHKDLVYIGRNPNSIGSSHINQPLMIISEIEQLKDSYHTTRLKNDNKKLTEFLIMKTLCL